MSSKNNSSSGKPIFEKPLPLEGKDVPAPAFPLHLLPKCLRDYLEDCAERMQAPVDMLAVPLIVTMAGLIGKGVVAKPKALDDWEETACLWGLVMAEKGSMKSQCISKMTAPLETLEREYREEYTKQFEEYKEAERGFKFLEQEWKRQAKKVLSEGSGNELPERPKAPNKPVRTRVVSTDATIEKLGEMMGESPGLTLIRDEMAGLLENLSRYSNGTDRQFYLECYSGGSGYVDRIGREPIFIDKRYLNLIGGVQPPVAAKLFASK
jgi:hypothetical protein